MVSCVPEFIQAGSDIVNPLTGEVVNTDPIHDLQQAPHPLADSPLIQPHRNPLVQELTGIQPVVEWILPEFLPRGSIFALAGVAGAGKSYLCYNLGMAIAAGVPVVGFTPARPFRVLYFDQENANPDRIQYERWAWHGLGCPDLNLLGENFWVSSFTLGGPDWITRAKADAAFHKPDLIFIDTATPACNIQDENDNGEATIAIGKLRQLQNIVSPAASIIVLKHAKLRTDMEGEQAGYTMRGAKAWEGAVDGTIFHIRGVGRPRKDHLASTMLQPHKTRAFGLREKIEIEPDWLPDGKGITLTRTQLPHRG